MRLSTAGRRDVCAMALGFVMAAMALAAMCVAARAGMRGEPTLTTASVRKMAPDFALTDGTGATVSLARYKGRVVLLDFWATWCHGCKTEIPWYMEFEDKYKERGLAVIGVSMDADGWKSVKPFMTEKKMNYDVVIGNDELAKKFELSNMPLTLLIDREGRIADEHAGVVDKAAWEQEIQKLLSEGRPATR
jgi:peroxiredoxin